MPKPRNAMEIFQHLDKSNCRECGEKTCLAFAGAVFQGRRAIEDCPRLDRETVAKYSNDAACASIIDQNRDEYLDALKAEIRSVDLAESARRIGANYAGGKLTLKILGKNFSVDDQGKLSADIHVNPWVAVPFLNYVLGGKGRRPTGNWLSFRELEGGQERYPLFRKRCEEAMKRVADDYPELFDDMVHIFGGEKVAEAFESDISVVLRPLPRIPVMICYWMPEDGLESTLNVFFDETATDNLDIGALFSLGAGLTQMFEKLSLRHGFRDLGASR